MIVSIQLRNLQRCLPSFIANSSSRPVLAISVLRVLQLAAFLSGNGSAQRFPQPPKPDFPQGLETFIQPQTLQGMEEVTT
jgi:hypothetical protein